MWDPVSRGESSVSPTEKMNRDCATIYLSDVNFPELFRYIFLYHFVVICLGYFTITSWTFFYCWKTTCIKRQTDNFKILAHRGRKPRKKQWWDKRTKAWRGMEAIEKDRKNLSFISYIEGVMIELILKQEIDRERVTVLSYIFVSKFPFWT